MNISIGKKILFGFGVVVILTVGTGWYGLVKLSEVQAISTVVADRDFYSVKLLRQISDSQNDMRAFRERAFGDYMMHQSKLTDEDPLIAQEAWQQARQRTESLLDEIESSTDQNKRDAVSLPRQTLLGEIVKNAKELRGSMIFIAAEVQKQFEILNRHDLKQLVTRTPILDRLRNDLNAKLEIEEALILELVHMGKQGTTAVYEDARISILIVLLIVVFLGSSAAFIIYQSVTRPLGVFTQLVEQVGNGDLTHQAVVSGTDELGRLGQSLNLMINRLKDVALQTRSATGNLNSATVEILASTQQQASGNAKQAASVRETSTTMEEVSESGMQITERAKEVASSAEVAATTSRSGIQAVRDMIQSMEAIREQAEAVAENIVALSEKTQAVGEIISTVTDIAEQSNLLALNASIESVSAGEQGQRFSVVANEMKTLADQAKEATVQVRSILEEIQSGINTSVMLTEEAVKRVESGSQQAGNLEDSISEMAGSIEESVNAFQQIVAATNQQQIGFEQVNQALKDIDQASIQTDSGTQQLEKAAANINALGQQLQKAVERYQV